MNLTPNPERVPGRMLTFDRNPRTDARHTTARTGPTGAAHGLASSPRFPTPPHPNTFMLALSCASPHARVGAFSPARLCVCTLRAWRPNVGNASRSGVGALCFGCVADRNHCSSLSVARSRPTRLDKWYSSPSSLVFVRGPRISASVQHDFGVLHLASLTRILYGRN